MAARGDGPRRSGRLCRPALLREPEYEARARIVATPIPPYDEALADVGLLTSTGDPTRDGQTFAGILETDRASNATGASA